MNDEPVVQAPARLMDERTEVGSLLTESEVLFRGSLDEGKAWKRIEPTLDGVLAKRRSRWRLLAFSVVTIGTAMGIGWYAGVRYARNPVQVASASGSSTLSVQAPVWTPLTVGESRFERGLRVIAAEGAEARYLLDQEGTRVQLVRGQLEFSVPQQPKNAHIFVDCLEHELRISAARFSLVVAPGCVKLDVIEGQVAILKDATPITVAKTGDRWTSEPCSTAAP